MTGIKQTKTSKASCISQSMRLLPWVCVVALLLRGREGLFPADVKQYLNCNSNNEKHIISPSPSSCIPKLGLRPLKNRNELPFLVEEHNLTSGIEIGVKQGAFAMYMLNKWKSCKEYHLVDVWAHQENYKDHANVDNATHNKFYDQTVEKMNRHPNVNTTFHRMYSTEAVKEFKNESIDFIYVDARHDYCGVKEDIELYWPILKPGGIMAGHDYNENSEVPGQDWGLCGDGSRNDMAVKGAVNDFFLSKGYSVSVTYYRQDNFMSWFVQKRLC